LALVGALALSACQPKENTPKTTGTKPSGTGAGSQPATPPGGGGTPAATPPAATPPTGGSTKSGALERGTSPATRDQMDPDGVIRRGLALTDQSSHTVAEVLTSAPALSGKAVKVAGVVGRVCEKSGCWMIIRGDDPEQQIRVTAKDYKFFVPATAIGKRAVVEGDLSVKKLSAEEIEHLTKDGAKPKSGDEVAISAVGLEVSSRG
jgi:hypothetical protein